jgi:hypothetical protein
VLAAHVQELLGISVRVANARLAALRSAGLLIRDDVAWYGRRPHRITRSGLQAIGSELPPPQLKPSTYWHDVGVAWLWLAARAGAFGRLAEHVSERRMRSADGAGDPRSEPFAVRLGGHGPGGQPRLHYPDLLLRTADGHRVAIELELSGKKRTHRERILSGYSFDRRVDAVVYLVDNPTVARAVNASIARLGLSSLVTVQRFSWDPAIRPPGRTPTARDAGRDAGRGAGARDARRTERDAIVEVGR